MTHAEAGGWLTIDVAAIVANWRMLAELAAPAECAAVVKADAYGLGAARVAPALLAAGCRTFFVAHLGEGIALRGLLGVGPTIHVLNGIPPNTASGFLAHDLLPVLNSVSQIAEWQALCARTGRALPATVQIDTGMSRFGLSEQDLAPGLLDGIETRLVMSHLGCADEPERPENEQQRACFERLRSLLPPAPSSLAASSAIFLGSAFHRDMVRPGAALYGIRPSADRPNPMRSVVRLQARIVQTRLIEPGQWVGYGARFRADRSSRIATLSVGYADGFLRAGGGRGIATVPVIGIGLPIVGRISMDCLAVDVTDVDPALLPDGAPLDLIGPDRPLDAAADAAGTVGYELLSSLGNRYERTYLE
jgi:alanine racemase